jgi:THO complex subunit 2
LALQEQERVANEEEEKRLKAALKAKREPGAATSRVSSPSIGATSTTKDAPVDQKPSVPEASSAEDVSMEIDSPAVRSFNVLLGHRKTEGLVESMAA